MRRYRLRVEKHGISRARFEELRAVFRQYGELRAVATEILGPSSSIASGAHSGSGRTSTVERAVIRREAAKTRLEAIDAAIGAAIVGCSWYEKPLTEHLCRGIGFEKLKARYSFISQRQFFCVRRQAYVELDRELCEKS